jgi:phage terminase large subunit
MNAQPFDWMNPTQEYDRIYEQRASRLAQIRANPETLTPLRTYYAANPIEFICDWGNTSDPRNKNKGIAIETPFVLFEKQRELLQFIEARMRNREPGLVEKSRDCGASWLICCYAATICLLNPNLVIGIGSRTESKLDRLGDPDSLFWKIKFFLKNLPPEFLGSWNESRHAQHLRIQFPDSGSSVVGESGDAIGRGGRSTAYFLDESAFIERPQLIEASLASNTDCRIDVSTPNGRTNSFATKRHSGRIPVFTFRWLDDPRKNFPGSTWYQRQVETLDPVTLAQEVDLSYDASTEGILISAAWIHAAIDAHRKLGIEVTGGKYASLDVADEGKDRNCFAGRHGILLKHLQSWSGRGSDIFQTVVKTINLCDEHDYPGFDFDSDGLGAGCRGDAVQVNAKRREAGKSEIEASPFRGSAAVFDPDGSLVEGRTNKDYFQNLKAQSYWALHLRFRATYRAVVEGMPYNPDEIISLDPGLEELNSLVVELSQPTFEKSAVGKILINKTPDGAASPNLADAVMIAYCPFRAGAFFAAPAPAAGNAIKVREMPSLMDNVFAVVSFLQDSAGVVYCASNPPGDDGTRGPPFHVLDWDLVELGSDIETWMLGIVRRLDELFRVVSGFAASGMPFGTKQIYFDDPVGTYTAFLFQRGIQAASLDRDFKDQLPPVVERFGNAKPYVNVGLAVIDRPAYEREVAFRGAKRNFLRELLSQAAVTESNPLALAFSTAVLMVFMGEPAVALPVDAEESALLQEIGLFGLT